MARKKTDINAFYANMAESSNLLNAVLKNYSSKLPLPPQGAYDPFNMGQVIFDSFQKMASDPEKVANSGMDFYKNWGSLWVESAKQFLANNKSEDNKVSADKRFKDGAWRHSPAFKFLKDSYFLYANWLTELVQNIDGLDKKERDKLEFYTTQFIDAISPSNFIFTNPEVLRATLESNGENLVEGLRKLAEDVKRGSIRQTDLEAFEVGKNLAITPGKVVFENDLMQLIQYEPQTKEVHKTPLLFIPAWINKYYIVDLRPENSLAKWLVEQGHTLFIISWVNPTAKHADKAFADYMSEGIFAAAEQIEKITGEKQINAIGYCLGGTLLATALAYMAEKKDERIKSATFLTTLLDFSDAGNLSVFIDDEQIKSLEKRMNKTGYLDGNEMAATFSMLRSNDLIWSFVVNNYLLGKDPFPFDILYWNSDTTRMPAKMHSFYLRNMYLDNKLAKPGGIKIKDVKIDLRKIKTPAYFLSTIKDHIAPWQSTFKGAQLLKNAIFTLADSGHVAGVVSPPAKTKYPHWVSRELHQDPGKWLKSAKEVEGSWWPDWDEWAKKYAGKMVQARKIKKHMENSPGSYVNG